MSTTEISWVIAFRGRDSQVETAMTMRQKLLKVFSRDLRKIVMRRTNNLESSIEAND
jgi:hypothetical protein